MTDHATPNLPARDFAATAAFYAKLGFEEDYRSDGWMILSRGAVTLEFFPYPGLDPYQSSFSCCLRLDDLGAMMRQVEASGVPDRRQGIPRYHPPRLEDSGLTIAYLLDPDGTLLRLIQNDRAARERDWMADIRIDRDSVCAGDDTESHAAVIAVDDGLSLAAVVDQVLANRYLASISGGKASWIIYADGKAVGVAAQQWARPRYLRDCAEARAPKVLRFGYAQQRCPAEVLQMIQHD